MFNFFRKQTGLVGSTGCSWSLLMWTKIIIVQLSSQSDPVALVKKIVRMSSDLYLVLDSVPQAIKHFGFCL